MQGALAYAGRRPAKSTFDLMHDHPRLQDRTRRSVPGGACTATSSRGVREPAVHPLL